MEPDDLALLVHKTLDEREDRLVVAARIIGICATYMADELSRAEMVKFLHKAADGFKPEAGLN